VAVTIAVIAGRSTVLQIWLCALSVAPVARSGSIASAAARSDSRSVTAIFCWKSESVFDVRVSNGVARSTSIAKNALGAALEAKEIRATTSAKVARRTIAI